MVSWVYIVEYICWAQYIFFSFDRCLTQHSSLKRSVKHSEWNTKKSKRCPPRDRAGPPLAFLCVMAQKPCCHVSTYQHHMSIGNRPFFFIKLSKKIFYLLHIFSVFTTDSTNVFYATRRTKLDLTCICFNDVLH